MNREYIDRLIIKLTAIKAYAKDIHYNCSGPDFYSNHLFADRIAQNMDDYIDQLKEVCLLGHKIKPLSSKNYLYEASRLIPNTAEMAMLYGDLTSTLNLIQQIEDVTCADENILGTIAQDIQNNVGLLNIMFEGVENGIY